MVKIVIFMLQRPFYSVESKSNDIILSLGLDYASDLIISALEFAGAHGVVVIAATGNNGTEINFPASFSTVLSVGGVKANDEVQHLSNYGTQLDIVAYWNVFTRSINSFNIDSEATSMAGPTSSCFSSSITM
ncbi:S8 family serine peptidase [Paenibacillus puerhi]|uniref:S8 family serine peptidase n=1 Tax=Paenibacillus puerhi TaxID=2692622 RepID=UPI001356B248|nr:S8 family serine peptidase [Paenibacillus puerhi]